MLRQVLAVGVFGLVMAACSKVPENAPDAALTMSAEFDRKKTCSQLGQAYRDAEQKRYSENFIVYASWCYSLERNSCLYEHKVSAYTGKVGASDFRSVTWERIVIDLMTNEQLAFAGGNGSDPAYDSEKSRIMAKCSRAAVADF